MSLDYLKEIFIYGNLDLVFSNQDIRNLDLDLVLQNLKEKGKKDFPEGYNWILFNNLNYLLNCYENWILSDFKKFKKFLNFLSRLIEVYKRIFNFKDSLFNISKRTDKDIFNVLITIFLNNIYDKLDTYKLQNLEINEIKFFLKFKDYLKPIEGKSLFLDFTTPYDNIKWTSKWKIIFESKEFYFEGIDIFLDSYVKNKNFTYNITMNKDIELFSKRINYLKNNQIFYFNIISKNIRDITERMFDVFPYSIIVKDYKDLILNSDLVYKPKILRNKAISKLTENYFLLSVIPDYLSSYLLGFPVISIDIPSASTLQKYMVVHPTMVCHQVLFLVLVVRPIVL